MKLYMNPVSTTCRPLLLFALDNNIKLDNQVVDLMTGEHYGDEYSKINPNHLVPVLDDGDFRLTESATILRYMAEKIGSDAYPTDIKERARVNELLDWFNTQLYRELGYHLVYPQVLPHHKRQPESVNEVNAKWGADKVAASLTVLNDYFLGPNKTYLVGDKKSIADYFGAGLLACGEIVHMNLNRWPNVKRWYENMKSSPSWRTVCEAHEGFVQSTKDQNLVSVG